MWCNRQWLYYNPSVVSGRTVPPTKTASPQHQQEPSSSKPRPTTAKPQARPANDSSPSLNATHHKRHDKCSMTESFIIDGLNYISIRDAAAASHLSTEYLARLARSGRIRARMIGRTWFIETDSLQQFLFTRTTEQ
jgi:excisionase family DNA binding protein